MKKSELLELIKDCPDDFEINFTQEDEKNRGEDSEMYLDNVTDNKDYEYIRFWFKWTRSYNIN